MKKSSLIIITLFCGYFAIAQEKNVATPLNSENYLQYDSLYTPCMKLDSTEKFMNDLSVAWIKFVKDFGGYQIDNGLKVDSIFRVTVKIYFNQVGKVEHLFYSEKAIPENQRETFKHLTNKFCINNKIDLTSDKKFQQCGSIQFRPKEDN